MHTVILEDLKKHADPEKALLLPRFFKCGAGEYGEGDLFLGVTVPTLRILAKDHISASQSDVETLLQNPYHEARLLALLILVLQYQRGSVDDREKIASFYRTQFDRINNWDLVDTSAYHILGKHLLSRSRRELYTYAQSSHLWTQRIAIVSTLAFIREGQYDDTFKIAEILLQHHHDLLHKATGWMLREVGKRDEGALRIFLDQHASSMPRTMLRYAIERMNPSSSRTYLLVPRKSK